MAVNFMGLPGRLLVAVLLAFLGGGVVLLKHVTLPSSHTKVCSKPRRRATLHARTVDSDRLKSVFKSNVLTGAPKFTTNIPMYFINLERDQDRRRYIEDTFGKAGHLTRIHGVDGRNLTQLFEYGIVEELTDNPTTCCNRLDVEKDTPGTVALAFSHFKAIKTALENGDKYAIVFEDDVSDMLVPYWQLTLDELVEKANDELPGWEVLRLQYFETFLNFTTIAQWFHYPTPFGRGKCRDSWGAVAQVYSRRGMETILKRSWDSSVSKWRCPKWCLSDYLIPRLLEGCYVVQPPMFTYMLTEGDRSVRGKTRNADHRLQHITSVLTSLQWNIELHELSKVNGVQSLLHVDWRAPTAGTFDFRFAVNR